MILARRSVAAPRFSPPPPPPFSTAVSSDVDRLAKLINDHPYPSSPITPLLSQHLLLPSPSLLEPLLSRLFSGHAAASKALALFRFALHHYTFPPSAAAFSTTLHILTRARAFPAALQLFSDVRLSHPSLLSPKPLAVFLSRHAKFRSFEDTLKVFDELAHTWALAGKPFGVAEFNALLRSFCTQRRMGEAKVIFQKFYTWYAPNTHTLNILLLGFKEAGNLMALDTFYHEMIVRGFEPDVVTYNIKIDAYCKKGKFLNALYVVEEMESKRCLPTVETMTTLIHGAGIVRNPIRAKGLFDEMSKRGLQPDIGAYNALMGAFVRCRDLKVGMEVMCEMEDKGIKLDDVSYYTMFWGLKRAEEFEMFCQLYGKMVESGFVPRTRTVMMLMKHFCENRRYDLGLGLWEYMVEKGCCPHQHTLDLLVTALCCSGNVAEAYRCFKQVVERGRQPSERGFQVLEGFLKREKDMGKLEELEQVMKGLETLVPASLTSKVQ